MVKHQPNQHVRELKNKDITRAETWQVIMKSRRPRDGALVSILFLTGCRISEILGGTLNYKRYYDPVHNRLYKRKDWIPAECKDHTEFRMMQYELEPLPKFCWQHTTRQGHEFIELKAPVLKGRKVPPEYTTRIIPVNENEKPFIDIVELYLKDLAENAPMFTISRQQAFRIIQKMSLKTFMTDDKSKAWFNHLLRHKRHNILAGEYYLDTPQIKAFSGWKSDSMPVYYAKQNKRDIINRMIQASKE